MVKDIVNSSLTVMDRIVIFVGIIYMHTYQHTFVSVYRLARDAFVESFH